jgi:hypothetical protein
VDLYRFGETEIPNFYATVVKEDVGWFEVSVHDFALVEAFETL